MPTQTNRKKDPGLGSSSTLRVKRTYQPSWKPGQGHGNGLIRMARTLSGPRPVCVSERDEAAMVASTQLVGCIAI
jgi:hypothetical protein